MKPNYYEFFGLQNFEKDQAKIKSAYLSMALKHHPDRNTDKAHAEHMMKQVNEIYEVLRDKKSKYDSYLRTKISSAEPKKKRPYQGYKTEKSWEEGSIFDEILKDDIFKYTFTDGGHYSTEETRNASAELRRKLKIKDFMDQLTDDELDEVRIFINIRRGSHT